MTLSPTDKFFAENGGAALLSAYGISGDPTLEAFFSTNLPAKPKEGVTKDRFTRPPATGIAMVAVWQGGMIVCSYAAEPTVKLPGIEFRTGFAKKGVGRIAMLAADLMDKPRPILVHACSTTYQVDLKSPRFTLDPSRIEVHGAARIILERSRLSAIRSGISATNLTAENLRKGLRLFESGIVADAPKFEDGTWALMAEKANRSLANLLGIKAKVFDADQRKEILDLWQVMDTLPPSSDAAWSAFDVLEAEEEAA